MKTVDFLIVGQGIAGSLLAMEMMRGGFSIYVLNNEKPNTSSNKAAGLYNPITGRKMVKTWLADELFPGLESYYQQVETELGARFLFPKTIYRPFFSAEEANDWQGKIDSEEYGAYIKSVVTGPSGIAELNDHYGGVYLNWSGYLDLPQLIDCIRKKLQDSGLYADEVFKYHDLGVHDNLVSYQNIRAKKIFFCEGPDTVRNPFWNQLPFKLVKGEILDISSNLPVDHIINRGVFVLPRDGYFRVGSTYDHHNLDFEPSLKGVNNLKDRFEGLYNGSYSVVNESAGVRPATFDRRPFIGFKPEEPNIGIFNGFGTKGVSLAPYFARQLVNYLSGKSELNPEADVKRVLRRVDG